MRPLLAASFFAFACAIAGPAMAQNEEVGVPILKAPYHLPVLGELVESVPGHADRGWMLGSGEFYWQEPGGTRELRNIGTTRIEIMEFEMK